MFNRSFFSNLPPVTKNLLILNIVVWAFLNIVPGTTVGRVMQLGGLHYLSAHDFGIWQFFTYMFIHKDFMHLFFNMWALLMFGFIVENSLGSKRFLFYYISCGIGAALVQMGVYAWMIERAASHIPPQLYALIKENGWEWYQNGQAIMPTVYGGYMPQISEIIGLINGTTIGASGAVFGVLLAMGLLYPNMTMYIMFIPYPIKAKWMVIGYGVIELFLGIGGPADGIAHFAHLGGMVFGFLMLWYWRKQSRRNGFN